MSCLNVSLDMHAATVHELQTIPAFKHSSILLLEGETKLYEGGVSKCIHKLDKNMTNIVRCVASIVSLLETNRKCN